MQRCHKSISRLHLGDEGVLQCQLAGGVIPAVEAHAATSMVALEVSLLLRHEALLGQLIGPGQSSCL